MADLIASPRIKRVQRVALVLLVLGGVINYIDRSTLAVGLPLIRKDLDLSLTQSGILLSAFLWTYAFAQLPAGILIDRFGARIMLAAGLGLWSVAQILGGMVTNFAEFVGARVSLGVGESAQFPSCARVVADWFHPRERGLASGFWNCSSSLGSAVSLPVLTFLMLHLGWRGMFITMGLVGLFVSLGIYLVHRNPREVALEPAEREYLADGLPAAEKVSWGEWGRLLCFRTTWGMIGGYFGAMYVLWIYNSWLPQYMEMELHVSIPKTGWLASIPFFCGVVGSITTGWVCDALLRRGFSPIASRKIPLVVSMFGVALCTLLASRTTSVALTITFVSASLFMIYSIAAAAWTMATAVAPTKYTASLSSIQNFFGYFGAALAPYVTGVIAQKTGSFRMALVVGAVMVAVGGFIHLFLVRDPVAPAPLSDAPRPGTAG
ncbi:MAG TPA: MFS transporter [Opitutaceae bacterium]|nr:MFS transporter [Opitutaceae bacterium]